MELTGKELKEVKNILQVKTLVSANYYCTKNCSTSCVLNNECQVFARRLTEDEFYRERFDLIKKYNRKQKLEKMLSHDVSNA